jgi:hypothetical protein
MFKKGNKIWTGTDATFRVACKLVMFFQGKKLGNALKHMRINLMSFTLKINKLHFYLFV